MYVYFMSYLYYNEYKIINNYKCFIALRPSFKKKPLEPEMYGAQGKNVTIRCNPEAAPKPKFTWKKDGLVIG